MLKGRIKEYAWALNKKLCISSIPNGKDHRTNVETSQIDDVMDGDLDYFIDAYLRQVKHEN